jgi:hypothetical protein
VRNFAKKIATLEAQLDKSMAPKPKAKLDFSFYENNIKVGEVHKSEYIPVEGEVVPLSFLIENNSPVSADCYEFTEIKTGSR